jgi:hypothetical protein|tara:strand:+ start:76 stop:318 length:243 start_codon:yes stop_codon:yes gene_type:complete
MTLISTKDILAQMPLPKAIEEDAETDYKSFPPVTDTIVWIKQVDWKDVGMRCKGGLNNVGLVLAVTGEKLYDFGSWLAQV